MFDSLSDPNYLTSGIPSGVHALIHSPLADVPIENLFSSSDYVPEKPIDVVAFVETHDQDNDLGDEVHGTEPANNNTWRANDTPSQRLRAGFADDGRVTIEPLEDLDEYDDEDVIMSVMPVRLTDRPGTNKGIGKPGRSRGLIRNHTY